MTQLSMMVVRALVRAVELAGVERSRFLAEAKLAALPLANIQARVPRDRSLVTMRTNSPVIVSSRGSGV